ncbi:RDD family protein [Mycobacterium sp.]|uniref:RDD family protein n=1 Tax=Mycobacterium sp. TaxID=1785 RepID=UPI003BABBF11
MTVVAEEADTTAYGHGSAQNILAPWHLRAGGFAIDFLPGVAVVATMALVSFTVPLHSPWWWVCVSVAGVVTLLLLVNRTLLPALTGWSLGRALFGIAVVGRSGAAAGPWQLLFRDIAHLVDTASVSVGWLWPLWDSRRRTFADMLLRTEVRLVETEERHGNPRRWTAVAVSTMAGLCVAGAVLSYVVVYQRDRAIDQTRAEIATRGPKIVAQMLTYDPKTLDEDFAHAQSLTTDAYRSQLKAQQEAVKKGHPAINEYWVTDSSVQTATPDRATMLLFMQGRRGEAPNERYITATVRVSFAKELDKNWRVDKLTVLTKPRSSGNGK